MIDVGGYMVIGPTNRPVSEWEVRCADHPLWEPMAYHLVTDHFSCTAGRVEGAVIPPCERTISATFLWERLY